MSRRTLGLTALAVPFAALTTACGDDSAATNAAAQTAKGPIKVWLSNNEQEVAWGKAVVEAWNAANPDQVVTAQEIPAGKSSEEAITAAITAGTAPDLVFNISTAAAPDWARQGGLIDLTTFPDGKQYIESRSGAEAAAGYADAEGKFYLLPWKSNPVMVMYNKDVFTAAGLDPENPGMDTYEKFLAASEKIVSSGASKSAIWPSPTSEFFQCWFDFYPLYLAQTQGTALVVDGKSTFASDQGVAVAEFWASMYAKGLAPKEGSTDDAMATKKTAMQLAGPWAIASYKGKVNVGFMPVPTQDGKAADQITTFADSKNVSMFTTSKNQGTAWEFLKFASSKEQDGALLEATGQMPIRADLASAYPDYFAANPAYQAFASQAARTADVPNVPNSIEVWQKLRDAYSSSVIFAKQDVKTALTEAAASIDTLVAG
ncbi:extracellular solute-binding protein [Micrococcales bacterium 31B]|nr:extracellular solute-binding protein [Micrococcales bacterium 31B]